MTKPRLTLEYLYSEQGAAKLFQYLGNLRSGCFSRVAAAQLGVVQSTLTNWLLKGKKEFEAGKDTLHAQFYTDTVEAVADARAKAEGMVMEDNPLVWLKRGPGRFLGDDWNDTPQVDHKGNLVEYEVDGTQTIKIEAKEEDTTQVSNQADIIKSLIELKKAGISLDQLLDMVIAGDYNLEDGLGPLIEQSQEQAIRNHIEGPDTAE